MQQIRQGINRFSRSKASVFLKRSFLFALLYSTLLYILVRVFFYEFPFTVSEGFELHNKILLVTWIFMITCKLVFTGIVLIENNISKMNYDRTIYIPVLKKIFLIMLTAALTHAGKTATGNSSTIADSGNNSGEEVSN